MMRKNLALALFGLFILAPLAAPPRASAEIGIQKDIHVAPGETQDKIFSLGGHVLIEGTVQDDVMVIGGSITISGEAEQSVVGIGSRIIVKSTAVIGKDLAALGGTLEKEPGCTVGGDTLYFQTAEIGDKIFKDGLLSGVFSVSLIPIIVAIKLVIIFLWLIAAFLGATLFPKPLAFASGEVRKSFWPAFGIGLLAIIAFSGLVLFAALLSIVLIGIPILLALVAAGFIIKVFGRLVVFYFLGDSLLRALGSRKISALGAVLAGLFLFSFIGFIPVIGFLFGLVMNAVGWGIALRTKFGTRENWFQKKPVC
ncbi:MAG: hypothetical protein MUQ25_03275 [Candidatus Aminicenantes bacterium]|nr:hypothetical protein [Candidatus Aminicenantes bacterium]